MLYTMDVVEYDMEDEVVEIELKKQSAQIALSNLGGLDFEQVAIAGEFTLTTQLKLPKPKRKRNLLPAQAMPEVPETKDRSQVALCGMRESLDRNDNVRTEKAKKRKKRRVEEDVKIEIQSPAKKKKKAKDSDNEGEDAAEDLADLDDGGKSPALSPSVHEECPPDNEVSYHNE